jgi:hypothetical protein
VLILTHAILFVLCHCEPFVGEVVCNQLGDCSPALHHTYPGGRCWGTQCGASVVGTNREASSQ